ncbi:TRAP transporter small permease [Anaerophilus nitritogenes]|uniref:TRAP transporter small permease n=1 Tax=Anaerophilus nitritogenes TaxID=2498136 RepID=UPI00101D59FE|nr:TRAP transporter small permease [Anaerophilus nitritogenes]
MKNKVLKALDKIEDTVLITMFMAMVGVICFQVIMRYVFNNSLSWSEELGKFLFVWLSWLGISIGHRRKEHIKITLLIDKLPYKLNKLAEAISELIVIVICGITMYYGFTMINIQMNIPYAGIKISTAWGYLSLVLGCAIFIIRAAVYLLEAVKCILKNEVIS